MRMETRSWIELESNKQKIFGIVHRPKGQNEAPLVVIMHGFASSKHGTNRCYVAFAEEFSKQGLATLRFDFRGAGDSEGSISDVSLEDLISDAVEALKYSGQLEGVDATRLGIFGSSLGATIAVLAAERHGGVKAMTLWSPIASGELWVHDFMTQNPQMAKNDPQQVLSSYKGIPLNAQFKMQFARMSAAKTIEKLGHVPLLHMHGECDKTVSLLHQQVYKLHCEGRAAPAKFISYPDIEHQLGGTHILPEAIQETVTWFKTHL